MNRMSIAMMGTRGVPARYGGFETAVEEIGRRLVDRGHEVVVYCRTSPDGETPPRTHRGMHLVHLPAARTRTLETLSHTALSVGHLVTHRTDAAIVFNAANAPLLPALRAAGIPVATHVDGLEWKRAKWGGSGRRYYRLAESLAVRWSDVLIADAQGIADYYREAFSAPTTLLTYGAPLIRPGQDRLVELGLEPGGYHLVVARFEPENNVHVIVEGYTASAARKPLIVVGSAPYADDYTRRVHALADGRVRYLGGVWDQELLDQLYGNCATYLHGHSVGGTNPSLLRAAGAGAAVTAYDVDFNREVLADAGRYFRTPGDVARLIAEVEADPQGTVRAGRRTRMLAARYDWDEVASGYEELARCLVSRQFPARRPSGRRMPTAADRPLPTLRPVDAPLPDNVFQLPTQPPASAFGRLPAAEL